MKIISWLLGLMIILVIGVYVIAFTSVGNAVLSPMIEAKIKEQTKLDSKLSTFSLGIDSFEILLDVDEHNSIYAQGKFSLLAQSFDAKYDVKLKKLETLEPLTNKPLKGSLFTDGTAKGTLALMKINGKSDIAMSATTYNIELTNLEATSIIAKVGNADLLTLLELVGEKPYGEAKIDADVNFKNIKPHFLDGTIVLNTKDGKLNSAFMSKEFQLEIPATSFSMNLDAKLKGDAITYTYALNSNLAKIKSAGDVIPEPLKVDVTYNLDVKELAVLKPIIKENFRGPLALNGTAKGTKQNMIVEGVSDIAASETQFSAILKDNKPISLNANIDNLQIAKLLYMLQQPSYGDGILSLNVDISDLQEGALKGTVLSSIKKGSFDEKYLTKEYKFATLMPKTSFNLLTNTTLDGDTTQTKLNFKSTLMNLDIEKADFNLKDKVLKSDFVVKVDNLDDLYFVTERHLKGGVVLSGAVVKSKDLDLVVHSNIAGGALDAKLFNDDLHVDLKSIQTLKALEMLIYPEVFAASLNGKLNYNLKEKSGKFTGDLKDGKFTQNVMLSMVKQYGQIDLYKEKFQGDVSADINQEKLMASLALNSNSSSIKTKEAKLNSKEKTVDATIEIVANNNPISIGLKGDTSAPAVTIDAKSMMEGQIQKAVGEKLNSFMKGFF